MHFADSRTGWAVGLGGTIQATLDGGTTWAEQEGPHIYFRGVDFTDLRTGWAVGNGGKIAVTRDGGASWKEQLSGTFENLQSVHFVDPQNGWVVGLNGTIAATHDGGAKWELQQSGSKTYLSAVHFTDASNGWAVGDVGTIIATRNGGVSWARQHSGTNRNLVGVHFADSRTGWTVGDGGIILATQDGGANWVQQQSGTESNLRAVDFVGTHTGWAVGLGGTIVATRDGGGTWMVQQSGTGTILLGLHFADARTGWAVGDGRTMIRAGPPIYAPLIDEVKTVTGYGGELDVSFHIKPEPNSKITSAQLWARVREAQWSRLGSAIESNAASGWWHLAWKPTTLASSGDKIEYQVRLDDGGPPFAMPLGNFVYDPWWAQLWRDQKGTIITGSTLLAILLIYAAMFGLILVFAPARLALVDSAFGLDELPKPTGNVAFFWFLARSLFERITLPWLCRHPRVRTAWTALYRDGKTGLDDLGKVARGSFLHEPDVLDAVVSRFAVKTENALQQLDLFNQRQIYVPFPVRVGQGDRLIERPSPETLRPIFDGVRTIIAIIGTGGSGKSTLACALARWAIAAEPANRLAAHRMLPVIIERDTANLVEAITQELRRMLGDQDLADDLVLALMAKQRLLVIVDALSERDLDTQRHVEQVFTTGIPLNALVITSRAEPNLGAIERTMLYPIRLDAANIVPFIVGYLDRIKATDQLKNGRIQLQLSERILAMAESGGRTTPITPLLVTLFVDSALRRVLDERSFVDMPEVVPEVFIDYLRRLNSNSARLEQSISDDLFIRAAQAVAAVSLGNNLVPQDFLPKDASASLNRGDLKDHEPALLSRLVASGVVERRAPAGHIVLRFSLDPVAEHLAAIQRLFSLRDARLKEWQQYLSSLENTVNYPTGPEGYLMALTTCYKAYKREFPYPKLHFRGRSF